MTPDLVIIGPLLVDHILDHDGKLLKTMPGGSALCSALAAALTGSKVGIVCRIGRDYPKHVLAAFAKLGIHIANTTIQLDASGRCLVTPKQLQHLEDRSYSYDPELFDVLAQPSELPTSWQPAQGFHICPQHDQYQREWVRYLQNHTTASISLDPFNSISANQINHYLDDISHIDFFMPSEHEFNQFADSRSTQAVSTLSQQLNTSVLLKRGADGIRMQQRGASTVANYPPPITTHIVDTMGAGDAFCGAFHSHWLQHHDLPAAIEAATVMAGIALSGTGPFGLLDYASKR